MKRKTVQGVVRVGPSVWDVWGAVKLVFEGLTEVDEQEVMSSERWVFGLVSRASLMDVKTLTITKQDYEGSVL
ncbi:hypothetical protein [Sulfuriferula sp.]|uniref:hypothetical protein n=1 Tax=Sulfuriferula sp. TaxID=2025307 RepID=UPI00273069B7|nr:hypothetical protein [Sulfuriferula sp.]MDP2025612.1 hypothetical protein [Sulfuriferula sp.]